MIPNDLLENIGNPDADRGVSPVIGVILMVAITVILAAVIATFVLGLGNNISQNAPRVTTDIADSDNVIEDVGDSTTGENLIRIGHRNGDSVDLSNVRIAIQDPETGQVFANLSANNQYQFELGTDKNNEVDIVSQLNGQEVGPSSGSAPVAFEDASFTPGDVLIITEDKSIDETLGFAKGDEVEVTLTHTPSNQQIASGTITVN